MHAIDLLLASNNQLFVLKCAIRVRSNLNKVARQSSRKNLICLF